MSYTDWMQAPCGVPLTGPEAQGRPDRSLRPYSLDDARALLVRETLARYPQALAAAPLGRVVFTPDAAAGPRCLQLLLHHPASRHGFSEDILLLSEMLWPPREPAVRGWEDRRDSPRFALGLFPCEASRVIPWVLDNLTGVQSDPGWLAYELFDFSSMREKPLDSFLWTRMALGVYDEIREHTLFAAVAPNPFKGINPD